MYKLPHRKFAYQSTLKLFTRADSWKTYHSWKTYRSLSQTLKVPVGCLGDSCGNLIVCTLHCSCLGRAALQHDPVESGSSHCCGTFVSVLGLLCVHPTSSPTSPPHRLHQPTLFSTHFSGQGSASFLPSSRFEGWGAGQEKHTQKWKAAVLVGGFWGQKTDGTWN